MMKILRVGMLLLVPALVWGQEATLPIPATIKTEGIPPIPMSLVEAVAPYGQFRQARMLDWHPTERRMLISTRFGAVDQVHEVRSPGGARTQLTFFRDGASGGAWYSPDGRSLIVRKDGGGGTEAFQLFRHDLDSGLATLLTDGKSTNAPPVWANKKRLIAYSSTRRDGKNRDLYVMDPSDPKTDRLVAQVEGAWYAGAWTASDDEIIALEQPSTSESYLWRVNVATGEKTPLTERGQIVRWRAIQPAPRGGLFLLGNRNSEQPGIWLVDPATLRWTAVTRPEDPVEDFAASPDGRTLAVVFDRGARSQLQLIDAATGRVRVTPALPTGVITSVAWRSNGSELAVTLAGSRSANDVYSITASKGAVTRWTMSEAGGASADALPDAEVVEWKSFDGLAISGVLYRPPARFTGPRPVIINIHGGPVERERPRFLGRSNYFRNEMGIAVIYPNVRGSFGRGRTFEELDNGRLRANAVKDIGALLDWIATQPSLDKSRVMIVGASYGGFLTLASAIEYGDRIRCAQAAFAISDFPSYLESTEIRRQTNRNAEYGDPSDAGTLEFLKSISPVTNAAKLRIPLFLVHGGKDTRVPPAQAELMVKAVKRNGTPLWYAVFEDAGHQQLTTPTNDFNQYAWTLFVQKYLLQ